MYKYAQLDEENICVGYKSILSKVNQEGYVLLKEDVDLSDMLYRKYNVETNEFSEEKYYPKVEEVPNEMDAIKEKVNTLEAENKELKDSVIKTQSAIDFILMNNGGI